MAYFRLTEMISGCMAFTDTIIQKHEDVAITAKSFNQQTNMKTHEHLFRCEFGDYFSFSSQYLIINLLTSLQCLTLI